MLKYHIIHPEKRSQNNSEFVHYLSLGSHSSAFDLGHLLALSKVTLTPKTHLPKLSLSANQQNTSSPFIQQNVIIPLYGQLSIDNSPLKNTFQANVDSQFKKISSITQFKLANNVEHVSNRDEKEHDAVFLYLVVEEVNKENNQYLYNKKFGQLSFEQEKGLDVVRKQLTQCLEMVLVQARQDCDVEVQAQSAIYLEKGKIMFEQIEIKNKGNKKGEQNYVENLVYFAQKVLVRLFQGTLLFLIRQL